MYPAWAMLGVALAGLLAACQVGVPADETRIATAGPMSGPYAVFGQQMKRGAEMAVQDINAKGGVNGKMLVLEVGDDGCDPKQAVAVANQFVNKGVKFVAGHFCSGSSIPASQVYNAEGILQISPASTNPKLTEQGLHNVFRIAGRDDKQGAFAADYVVAHQLAHRVAIVDDQTAYGKGIADAFEQQFAAHSVQATMRTTVTQGEQDFTALVARMEGAGVDLIYYGGYHTEAGRLVRQAREQGLSAVLVSDDALVDKQYWQVAGPAGEGTLMTFAADPRKNPAAVDVVRAFTADGYDPAGYTLYTYAAVQAFAEAAGKAASTEPAAVAGALRADTLPTVLGPLGFDAKGDVQGPSFVMYRWHDGQYGEIGG